MILKVWKQTLKRCWKQTLKMETNPEEKLPKLSKHWEELTPPTSSDDEDEVDYGAFQVIIL
jgi:hypothetical protein